MCVCVYICMYVCIYIYIYIYILYIYIASINKINTIFKTVMCAYIKNVFVQLCQYLNFTYHHMHVVKSNVYIGKSLRLFCKI